MEVISRASKYLQKTAVQCRGRSFTYRDLLTHSSTIKDKLLQGRKDLEGDNIVFLSPQSYEFIPVQWGIWQAGGVSVPLCLQHPPPEWEYIIDNCKTSTILCSSGYLSQLGPIAERKGVRLIPYGDFSPSDTLKTTESPTIEDTRGAQIIYTSGTTGKPKGVVTTHRGIKAQVSGLHEVWRWTENDHILHVLPLHHVHGNIVSLTTALYSGAKLTFQPKFSAQAVWKEFISSPDLNIFMGVPTMYAKLIAEYHNMTDDQKVALKEACRKFRLIVSGSMAMPENTLKEWERITGQKLVERYGMTECGIILSNPLLGYKKAGYVGTPLPGVEVKLVDSEIRVKSEGMFKEYLYRPEDTKQAFDEDGWLKTGDIAIQDDAGNYKIQGRASVDIIKSGGYKISALDIENELVAHPDIDEVSIVGVPDKVYGQIIGAVFTAKQKISLQELQHWSKERMAPYKVPKVIRQLNAIPRNQMGKVNKKELASLFS